MHLLIDKDCITRQLKLDKPEKKLVALTCSCCGAPVEHETMTCNYCGTHFVMPELETVTC